MTGNVALITINIIARIRSNCAIFNRSDGFSLKLLIENFDNSKNIILNSLQNITAQNFLLNTSLISICFQYYLGSLFSSIVSNGS